MESLILEHSRESTSLAFRNIVVGFDCEEPSPDAILAASALAARNKGSISLVYAVYPPIYAGYVQDLNPFVEQTLQRAKARLEDLIAQQPALRDCQYRIVVDIKNPAELLCRVARERSADLIVVGSHGRHGIEQILVGSVSESLLDKVPCPVMIVGPECSANTLPCKRILFATTVENNFNRAALYAASLSAPESAKLSVIHVVPTEPCGKSDMRGWIEDEIRRRLALLFEPASLDALPHELLVAYGNPAEEILSAARSSKADLIILGAGSHSYGADHNPCRTVGRVIREAHCPVLSVNPNSKWPAYDL